MKRHVLILGSGPAAAATASVWSAIPDTEITVLDVGGQLEDGNRQAQLRLATESPGLWRTADLALVTKQPEARIGRSLPEKRSYGSDFPFRDFGQREGLITTLDGVNDVMVSGAYGGFSNVWGAQVMPFSKGTFDDWPISYDEMQPHYAAILGEIPFSAEEDDLAERFPLLAPPDRLPVPAARTEQVLRRYAQHRQKLQKSGVTLGKARLAFQGSKCLRAGLCMTGCPYSLIYSASQTFDELRKRKSVRYLSGWLATRIREDESSPSVIAKNLATGEVREFAADRVFVACGAIGTSRLVMSSLALFDQPAVFRESAQFMLPFLSIHATPSPFDEETFTLNQFNMVVDLGKEGRELSQLHFYTFNPAFLGALPRPMASSRARLARDGLLKRLTVALGYVPSWASPEFKMTVSRPANLGSLGNATFISGRDPDPNRRFLRKVIGRTLRSAPLLDLWPALPALSLSSLGKSYHWGGSFAHSKMSSTTFSSDLLGRVGPWKKVHLVDAAVFPNVPATTFTLSIMANAHRIATAAVQERT